MAKKAAKPKVKFKGERPESDTLKARINQAIMGPKISFPHRHLQVIDTGVEVDVAPGYRLRISLNPSLADRGMVATNAHLPIKQGPVKVAVLNCGREIVEVKDGDPLVRVWLEADHEFEWEDNQ